ncbi:MAG: hydroxypyruvate isomerase [Proteobacteria bacterium]|nr:hydroxypyruvate isomerase [Pseudomonadota bacterium]
MPRFAANISFLFTEIDFLDRFAAAAEAGFSAVEWHFPYGFDTHDLAQRLADNGLRAALFNLPPGDWDGGERGIACLPGRVAEFEDGVGRAIDYAKALGCRRINCLAGLTPAGADIVALRETFVSNLRHAAARTAEAEITLLIEPINTVDMPGFYLNYSKQALSIIDEVGATNLKLQYDVYHMHIMEGDMASTIEAKLARIGHIQIADVPGRHEPGTGEIDYPSLFDQLDRLGYGGWIGCEYKPATTTAEGLGWAEPYLVKG